MLHCTGEDIVLKAREIFGFFLSGSVGGLIYGALSPLGANPGISHTFSLALWPFVGGLSCASGFVMAGLTAGRRGGLIAAFATGGLVFGTLSYPLVPSRHTIAFDALVYMISAAVSGLLFELILPARGA